MSKTKRVMLLCGLLLVCTCAFFVQAPRASASAQSTCGATHWSTDTESTIPYKGQSLSRKTVQYFWDISILSLRDNSTNAYCGKISDHVCLTVPVGIGWPSIGIENEWYVNGPFVNNKKDYFNPPNTRSATFCSYSGSFSVSRGSNVLVLAYMSTPDGNSFAGQQTAQDNNVS